MWASFLYIADWDEAMLNKTSINCQTGSVDISDDQADEGKFIGGPKGRISTQVKQCRLHEAACDGNENRTMTVASLNEDWNKVWWSCRKQVKSGVKRRHRREVRNAG